MMITTMVLFFLLLSSGSVLAAAVSSCKYETALPLTVLSSILLLYIFYYINAPLVGFWAVAATAAGSYVAAAVLIVRKKNWKEVLGRLVTPGFVVFVLLYGFLFFRLRNWIVMYWDELRLWGAAPKILFYTNSWLTGDTMLYPSMQPRPIAMALFQYLLLRVNGSFREGYLFVAYTIYSFSMLLPALRDMKWRRSWAIPPAFLLLLALPMTSFNSNYDFNNFYTNLFIDAALGLTFGYLISAPILHRQFDFLSVLGAGLALCVLPLLKASGYFLAVVGWIVFGVSLFFAKREEALSGVTADKKKFRRRAVALLLLLFALPNLSKFVWDGFVRSFDLTNKFVDAAQSKFALSIFSPGNPVLRTYGKALLFRPLINHGVLPPFKWSYAMVFLAFSAACLLLLFVLPQGRKRLFFCQSALVLFFSVIYSVGLYVLYATGAFGPVARGNLLPSFQRYLSAYLLGIAVFLFAAVSDVLARGGMGESGRDHAKPRVIAAVVAALLLGMAPLYSYAGFNFLFARDLSKLQSNPYADRSRVAGAVRKIERAVPPSQRRTDLYLVMQGTPGEVSLEHHMIYYELLGRNIFVRNYFNNTNAVAAPGASPEKKKVAVARFGGSLRDYDYVFLYRIGEEFKTQCGPLFAGGGRSIVENGLYRVERSGDAISLRFIQ